MIDYSDTSKSQLPPCMRMTDIDLKMLLVCNCHLGTKNLDQKMNPYIYTRREDGIHLINLSHTWSKLIFAAKILAAARNPADICVISSRPIGQRAVSRFAEVTEATPIVGKFTPGTFTNHTTRTFREPQIILVSDPLSDHQAVKEASSVGITVIAFADADSSLKCVDVAIPINNKAKSSVALGFWMLAREIKHLKGLLPRDEIWEVTFDMFVYREPEEQESSERRQDRGEQPHSLQQADRTQRPPAAEAPPALTPAPAPVQEDSAQQWGGNAPYAQA